MKLSDKILHISFHQTLDDFLRESFAYIYPALSDWTYDGLDIRESPNGYSVGLKLKKANGVGMGDTVHYSGKTLYQALTNLRTAVAEAAEEAENNLAQAAREVVERARLRNRAEDFLSFQGRPLDSLEEAATPTEETPSAKDYASGVDLFREVPLSNLTLSNLAEAKEAWLKASKKLLWAV